MESLRSTVAPLEAFSSVRRSLRGATFRDWAPEQLSRFSRGCNSTGIGCCALGERRSVGGRVENVGEDEEEGECDHAEAIGGENAKGGCWRGAGGGSLGVGGAVLRRD